MVASPLSKLTRAVSRPVRTFVNEHVAAIKDEIRRSEAANDAATGALQARLDAVEAALTTLTAEVERVCARVDLMRDEVNELRVTHDQVLAVVAALVERPEPPPNP